MQTWEWAARKLLCTYLAAFNCILLAGTQWCLYIARTQSLRTVRSIYGLLWIQWRRVNCRSCSFMSLSMCSSTLSEKQALLKLLMYIHSGISRTTYVDWTSIYRTQSNFQSIELIRTFNLHLWVINMKIFELSASIIFELRFLSFEHLQLWSIDHENLWALSLHLDNFWAPSI